MKKLLEDDSFLPSVYYQRMVEKYGAGFFAIYKKAKRVAAWGKDINSLWRKLKKKNVDLKKVVITRLPLSRWKY